jgi:hypothetical protein
MPKRSSNPPSDPIQAAHSILAQLTGEEPRRVPPPEKDPIAVELGRRGGLKGGKRRLESMTPEQRKESARKAASARWSKETTTEGGE